MSGVHGVLKEKIFNFMSKEEQEKPPFFISSERLHKLQDELKCSNNELLLGLCRV